MNVKLKNEKGDKETEHEFAVVIEPSNQDKFVKQNQGTQTGPLCAAARTEILEDE